MAENRSLGYKVEERAVAMIADQPDFAGLEIVRGHRTGDPPQFPVLVVSAEGSLNRGDLPPQTLVQNVALNLTIFSGSDEDTDTTRDKVEEWLYLLQILFANPENLQAYSNLTALPDVRPWAPLHVYYSELVDGSGSEPEVVSWQDTVSVMVVAGFQSAVVA